MRLSILEVRLTVQGSPPTCWMEPTPSQTRRSQVLHHPRRSPILTPSSSGVHSVRIQGRTVFYTGTFFGGTKLDSAVRAGGGVPLLLSPLPVIHSPLLPPDLTVIVELLAETWVSDVASDLVKRRALLSTVFASNRNGTSDTTYANALQVSALPCRSIETDSDDPTGPDRES